MAWCHQASSHYLSQCWPRSCQSFESLPQAACSTMISNIANYNWVPLQWGPLRYYIAYSTAVIGGEHKSEFQLTKDTPYLALTDKLWSVYYENLGENRSCYNSIILYLPKPANYISAPHYQPTCFSGGGTSIWRSEILLELTSGDSSRTSRGSTTMRHQTRCPKRWSWWLKRQWLM